MRAQPVFFIRHYLPLPKDATTRPACPPARPTNHTHNLVNATTTMKTSAKTILISLAACLAIIVAILALRDKDAAKIKVAPTVAQRETQAPTTPPPAHAATTANNETAAAPAPETPAPAPTAIEGFWTLTPRPLATAPKPASTSTAPDTPAAARSAVIVADLATAQAAAALPALQRGDQITLPLPTGETTRATVNLSHDDEGTWRVGGSLPDKGNASFSLALANNTQLIGLIILPADHLAYKIEPSAASGSSVMTALDLSDVMCNQYAAGDAPAKNASTPARDAAPAVPTVPKLNSRPGATAVIYLIFDGATVTDTAWNAGKTIVADPFPVSESTITEIWSQVAEDYSPFNINVTTDPAIYNAAPAGKRIRCIITPTKSWSALQDAYIGVAMTSSFSQSGPGKTFSSTVPCWVFVDEIWEASEAIAHEIGHTLGLSHDGLTTGSSDQNYNYFGGQGNMTMSWNAIMGSAAGTRITQWSKGEYANANNHEDDIAIIASTTNGFGFYNDPHATTLATAATSAPLPDGGNFSAAGVIRNADDAAYYKFTVTTSGTYWIAAAPKITVTTLDIDMEIQDPGGNTLYHGNQPTDFDALISCTLAPGAYYIKIKGSGYGDPLVDGYTNYGSVGQYILIGSSTPLPRLDNLRNLPKILIADIGDNLTLTSPANMTPAPQYHWEISKNNGDSWTTLADDPHHTGTQTATLNIINATADMHGWNYRFVSDNGTIQITGNTSTLLISTSIIPTRFTTQPPSAVTLAAGASTTINAITAGNPAPTNRYWRLVHDTPTGRLDCPLYVDSRLGTTPDGSLTITNAGADMSANEYVFYCCVTDPVTGATIYSNNCQINVTTLGSPAGLSTLPATTIVAGGKATLTATATGATTYRWQYCPYSDGSYWTDITDNAIYNGATTATLTITNPTPDMNGYTYRYAATNATGTAFSNFTILDLALAPTAFSTLPYLYVAPSSTIAIGGTATYTAPYSYTGDIPGTSVRWQTSADTGATWNDITTGKYYYITDYASYGITNGELHILNAPATLNGNQYRYIVENTRGLATSNTSTLAVIPATAPAHYAPLPDTLGVSMTNPVNLTLALTTTAPIAPTPTYQWQISTDNGTTWNDLSSTAPYTGVKTATLHIANADTTLLGNQYRCIATNPLGTATSNATTIMLATPPVITSNPVDASIINTGTATFSVTATSSVSMTYQWQYYYPSGTAWSNLYSNWGASYGGATVTTPTLAIIPASTSYNNYQYRCIVSNASGTATSTAATLKVTTPPPPPPVITKQPLPAIITAGDTATLTITATGNPSPTSFQWQSSPNGSTWTTVPNTTPYTIATTTSSSTLTITKTPYTLNGIQYHCTVSNGVNPAATSDTVKLTVNPDQATADAIQLKKLIEGSDAGTITMDGTIDLTLVNGATLAPGKSITGTSSSATITGLLTIPANVNNTAITGINFATGTLAINAATDIEINHCTFTDAPVLITGAADNITFTWNKFTATTPSPTAGSAMRITGAPGGSASGIGILLDSNYWADGLKTDIPTVTNARLYMVNNYIATPGNTSATVSGSGAQILSQNNIYQDVANPLAKQSTGLIRSFDNYMSGAVTGAGANNTPYTDPTVFVPAYSQVLQPAGDDAPGAATLATRITAAAGNTPASHTAALPQTIPTAAINATATNPAAIINPTAASIPDGAGFTLTASATGFNPIACQWYRNNFIIAGANTGTYTVVTATAAAHAGAYSAALTTPDPAGEIVTTPAYTVTVGPLAKPKIVTQPQPQTTTAGGSATFTVVATTDQGTLTYQWQKNGTPIPGETRATLTITNAQTTDAATYTVTVSNAPDSSVTSNAVKLTVNPAANNNGNGGNNNTSGSSSSGGGGGGGAPSLLYLAAAAALLTLRASRRRHPEN